MASVTEQYHHQQDGAHYEKDMMKVDQNGDKEMGENTITDAEVERVYK